MNRQMVIKIGVSLGLGAGCLWYVLRGMDGPAVLAALHALPVSAILIYLATLAVTHFFRAWRWEYLLRPLGVSVPLRRLMLISSVGFMAILVLPFRLGEFVRPYFLTRERGLRMSASLGTVAVERIIDGLMISILFFVAYLVSAGDMFPRALRVGAWLSLLGFLTLTVFLAFARVWTEQTIAFALRVSLLPTLAPKRAHQVADKLRALISGFHSLTDKRNFTIFLVQSVLYWGANGVGMWILAQKMGLPISVGAAFAAMSFTGVVLSAPNSPGLVGMFQFGITLALQAYLPAAVVNGRGLAYAFVLHGLQTVWYVGVGLLALAALTPRGAHTSLAQTVRESTLAAQDANAEPQRAEGV